MQPAQSAMNLGSSCSFFFLMRGRPPSSTLFPYTPLSRSAVKPAEQVYKNIVELKGIPADQVGPAMQFIAASLGVNCEFCHVQGKFEADDKGAKKTARNMIAMQNMINKNSFGGRTQVTCNTCHRGAARPVAVRSGERRVGKE